MKSLFLITTLLSLFALFACDDDPKNTNNANNVNNANNANNVNNVNNVNNANNVNNINNINNINNVNNGDYTLSIVVTGDATPIDFDDGSTGQTPTNYFMGLQRFDLMRSAQDPAPVIVFDHGTEYVEVNMSTSQTVATVNLLDLPLGLYTHGRVLLTMTRFDVLTTVHVTMPPTALPGTMSVVGALSDCVIDGTARTQDWAEFTFNVAGGITRPGALPGMPATGGGTIVREGGRTWMVFPLSESLNILPVPGASKTATITYYTYESFRWTEQDEAGYAVGTFDTRDDGAHEPLTNFGALDYAITIE